MTRPLLPSIAGWLALALLLPLAAAAAERALCHVCRVHDGETEEERVVATATHGGQTFGFCSEKCRDTFVESPEGYLPPVFPRPAPEFVVRDLDGREFPSSELRGRVVLIDFWATWCPPCVDDLPRLSRMHQRLEERGLTVVGISIDEGDDARDKVARMVRRRKAEHPIYLDGEPSSAWGAYHVMVVPSQFLVDAEGQIVAQWSGKIDLKRVEEAIVELLDAAEEAAQGSTSGMSVP